MSVLNEQPRQELTQAEQKANRIKRSAKQSTDALIQGVVSSLSAIWEDENPQDVLDALGTDAQELFELNTNTVAFLAGELTGKRDNELGVIMGLVAKVQAHTVNEDGSVTID